MKEQDIKFQSFKTELKALLKKYNATIEYNSVGYTCVTEEELVVNFSAGGKDYTLSDGATLSNSDLED